MLLAIFPYSGCPFFLSDVRSPQYYFVKLRLTYPPQAANTTYISGIAKGAAVCRGSGCPRKTSFLSFCLPPQAARRRRRRNWGHSCRCCRHPKPRQGGPCAPFRTYLSGIGRLRRQGGGGGWGTAPDPSQGIASPAPLLQMNLDGLPGANFSMLSGIVKGGSPPCTLMFALWGQAPSLHIERLSAQ